MKQTAVEWLAKEIKTFEEDYGAMVHHKAELTKLIKQAKEMESDREYETKAFWFGRGILAGKENKIKELQPQKETKQRQ